MQQFLVYETLLRQVLVYNKYLAFLLMIRNNSSRDIQGKVIL
jgi:hypothetical protein